MQNKSLLNGFTFLEELPFELLYTDYKNHRRLMVFAEHGLDCVVCHLHGARLVKSQDKGGGIHVDIYSENWVLMTVDHIIPRAEKGGEELSNKQPMCSPCNNAKGSKIISVEELRMSRLQEEIHVYFRVLFPIMTIDKAHHVTSKVFTYTSGGSLRHKDGLMPRRPYRKLSAEKRKMRTNIRVLQTA